MTTKTNPRRDPWSIDDSELYELEHRDDEMAFLLRYAILAPSGHNTQPWTFAIVPGGIEVFADYSRRLPQVDPADRELLMSVGAAIFNLRVAAAHFGFEASVLYPPHPSETSAVALVSLRETCAPDASLRRLFPAIVRRRTNRQPFDGEPIETSPLLVVITAEDDPISLVEAGQVLEQLLLTATLGGLQYSFMNQPVQVATLRNVLAPIVSSPHPPQLLLRIGYAPPVELPMPRRDVAEVLR